MIRPLLRNRKSRRRVLGLRVSVVSPGRTHASALLRISLGEQICATYGFNRAGHVRVYIGDENDRGIMILEPTTPDDPEARVLVARSNTPTKHLILVAPWLPVTFRHPPERIPDKVLRWAPIPGRPPAARGLWFTLPSWALIQNADAAKGHLS